MIFSSHRPHSRVRRRRAFTVVEVAVAGAVLALSITTSLTVIQSGFRLIDNARKTTIAAQVLQSMIEDVRLLTWAQVSSSSLLPDLTDQPLSAFDLDKVNRYQSRSIIDYSPTAANMISRYRFSRTVTNVAGRTNMKHIVLTATWTGIDGKSHTLQSSTYYGQDGLYAYYSS